ncbi:MAG: dockerin type I repeat-containing protein [Clostridia bacterium]|nr:dockerin type I repeat-containing protein [Clostridia bacterium]
MKTKLLKACSLLLAISMLIIPASIVSGAEGISDVEAVGTSVALDGTENTVAKVGIAFTADVYCYGIQGTWDKAATNNADITLGSIEFCGDEATFTDDDDYVSPTTGNVMWTDLEFIGGKFSKGSKLLTATYIIPADTAPGEYKVGFLCEVYTDASGFPVEFENTYLEATITVTCDRPPVLQPGQASGCDTDGWNDYYKCNVCGKYYTDAEGNNPIDDIETWKTGDGKIPAGHTSTEVTYDNVTATTHDEYYACCGVEKATGVEHIYNQENNTKCLCGAVKLTVTFKGAALANAYTVSGNVVNVKFDIACKLGYWDATSGKYVAIAAVANPSGGYDFTVPAGVTEVLLVIKGDANATGGLDSGDLPRIKAVLMGRLTLTAEEIFAADANDTGTIDSGDLPRIKAVLMGRTSLAWG